MAPLRRLLILSALLAGCLGDHQTTNMKLDSAQVPSTPSNFNFPRKTTTRHTTTHSTLHTTTHTTVRTTTAHTNHTTTMTTTTTAPHTNHTTTMATTTVPHTNHTTTPHINHTTTMTTTPHTNHTTTMVTNHTTTMVTNHTTTMVTNHTTAPTNHTATTPHFNHTTALPPTSAPAPSEYFVNGTAGVCLRITANFVITINVTKIVNVTIPPPPETKSSGKCSNDTAELSLFFPNGNLTLTFRQNKTESKYKLGGISISMNKKGSPTFSNLTLEDMSTPLGRSFACKEVSVKVNPNVTFVLTSVKAQAFQLSGGNYGTEYNCAGGSRDNTVPIVVGIVLLVLIIAVVLAYIIARQRRHRGGYQSL